MPFSLMTAIKEKITFFFFNKANMLVYFTGDSDSNSKIIHKSILCIEIADVRAIIFT